MNCSFLPVPCRITKAVNIHPIAKKWNPLRRSTTTTAITAQQQQFHSRTTGSGGGGAGAGGGSSGNGYKGGEEGNKGGRSGKGKFLRLHKAIPKQWTWSAGAGWTILSVLDWWLLVAGGWLSWQGVILRWTPLGVCLAAAIQWHLHNRDLDRKGLPRTATTWQVSDTRGAEGSDNS